MCYLYCICKEYAHYGINLHFQACMLYNHPKILDMAFLSFLDISDMY